MQTDATLLTNNFLHCWMSQVLSLCTPCCKLLDFVAQSLKPVKLFSQQLPTFLLFRDRRSVAQQCWIRLIQHCCATLPTLLGPRTLITHGLQRLMGYILPTMYCGSQTCWELLHPFAHHCQHARNNNVGSCCAHTFARSLNLFQTLTNNTQQHTSGCANERNL